MAMENDGARGAMKEVYLTPSEERRWQRMTDKRRKKPKSYKTGLLGEKSLERSVSEPEQTRRRAAADLRASNEREYWARDAQNEARRAQGRESFRQEKMAERDVKRRMAAIQTGMDETRVQNRQAVSRERKRTGGSFGVMK